MIVYLHGFRSSPASRKAQMIAARLAALGHADRYRCPALPVSPRQAAKVVLDTVSDVPADHLALIGSSLGGYYATWAAEKLGCRAALLNPAITPAEDLAAHLGRQPVFFSDDEIELTPSHLDELRELDTSVITRPERYFLLAATGDQLIDYRQMLAKYRGCRQRIVDGSDHEFSDFSNYIDEVLAFCCAKDGVAADGNG